MKPTESKHDVYITSQNSLRMHHILLLKTGKLYLQNKGLKPYLLY